MAGKRGQWSMENLEKALQDVRENQLSVRAAAQKHEVPKSTLHDHLKSHDPRAKPGPAPILNRMEEDELVKWIVDMSEIGYGQCRQQVCLMVKKILDRDHRANPFPDNMPGKDWWHGFLRRNPQLSIRTPQALQICRAKACSPETMNKWYADYEQFLLVNDLLDKPSRIWNCDESGFAMCPRSNKVLAPRGTKNVYYATSSDKGQITTLACISAAGDTIHPYAHISWGQIFLQSNVGVC